MTGRRFPLSSAALFAHQFAVPIFVQTEKQVVQRTGGVL